MHFYCFIEILTFSYLFFYCVPQYENGGGAFLIPYLVVLLLIGKPLYFLEMILGQFSSFGSVKVWSVVPFAKGVFLFYFIFAWKEIQRGFRESLKELFYFVPIFKGIGYCGALATWFVVTYYCCLMALTVFYFFSSFQTILPWTTCNPSWADELCYNSSLADNSSNIDLTGRVSSVEQFFTYGVLFTSLTLFPADE